MNFYYITGTSRGLGKALAEYYLSAAPNNRVIGISRTSSIAHPNYTHYSVDLCDVEKTKEFHFPPHHNAKRIVLINNAGMIGMIKRVGKINSHALIEAFHVNLVSPSLLINGFMDTYEGSDAEKIIVNVSSGAGKYPIGGWAGYCAAKAGIDLFSKVVAEEQLTAFGYKFRIHSIAPGVVDTQMQEEIRSASPADFSRLTDFINYKIENQLAHPGIIAEKYAHVLDHPDKFTDVILSVKDIEVKH
jgi:benzil reductase ((S)-benzoin forming)